MPAKTTITVLTPWDPAPTDREPAQQPTGTTLNDACTALRFGMVARPYIPGRESA